ncbi:hypothetical protein HETIRDRAFT_421274 [Heterobasidion irregulare TC 32-1]|uniref:Uncharacterized protein n=1 Tax=Heterobasidion irregulare (strain TC 32-1) TaxID=747525 RepID=W4JW30_HETIT|nr:uncharacterized protein HETIRDRAFT_421274 [Heterobasidion irregulare TC 32-1]ETW77091.1 hypothetical protein HETIRDRAFT_421274 [Heterobasidion irregulare TC 32-1]
MENSMAYCLLMENGRKLRSLTQAVLQCEMNLSPLRRDKRIGGISESIATLCPSILDGRSHSITKTILEGTSAHVGFRLAVKVDNPPEPANLLSSAKAALSNMKSPASPIALAIGASTSALEPVKDFVDNWTALLSQVQTFCELMDGIAEVHPYAKMAWSVISIPQKVFHLDLDDVSRDADQISCS